MDNYLTEIKILQPVSEMDLVKKERYHCQDIIGKKYQSEEDTNLKF